MTAKNSLAVAIRFFRFNHYEAFIGSPRAAGWRGMMRHAQAARLTRDYPLGPKKTVEDVKSIMCFPSIGSRDVVCDSTVITSNRFPAQDASDDSAIPQAQSPADVVSSLSKMELNATPRPQ